MPILKKLLYSILAITVISAIGIFIYLYFPSRQSSIPFDYSGWDSGPVRHILPQFDHEQILIKVSFDESLDDEPLLIINGNTTQGISSSSDGRFWQFFTEGLSPATQYTLQIKSATDRTITDPWHITTFPHPDSTVSDLRILKYTCAGGISESFFGQEVFLDMKYRRELLKRALREDPRIVIANGDHIYWDQKTSNKSRLQQLLKYRRDRMYGKLDLNKSMLDESNYDKFKSIVDDQIVELYGCHLRDKSVYFITDDHDLFENDDAIKEKGIVSFPPEEYMSSAADITKEMYYPECLNGQETTSSFCAFNYGNLLRVDLFDAKAEMTMDEANSVLVESAIELKIRNSTIDNSFVWHFAATSSPFGWTAGKWLEWYPDILDGEKLTKDKEKYLWQEGWWNQHQRLLTAFYKRKNPSIILQGDLHMASYGMINKSGDLDFSSNPIPVITTAPLGSGKLGFPSSFRGIGATVPIDMEMDEIYKPVERNGFTILDVTRDQVTFDIYTWRLPETIGDIRSLQPSFSSSIDKK